MKYLSILIILFSLLACNPQPEIEDSMLDGEILFDASLYNPADYLVSEQAAPDNQQAQIPVIILGHGYSASTFEWDEFRSWSTSNNDDILISQVLLGGHGRTYEEFRQSTWKDWMKPLIDEYQALLNLGYQNISFAGSSTGGALILKMLEEGEFDQDPAPNQLFLIDPIVIPGNKLLTLSDLLGPMLGYTTTGLEPNEEGYWYHFRPQETLRELNSLIIDIRKDLEDGMKLPAGTSMKVYKSISDGSADPASAVLIYKGLRTSEDELIDIEMIDSDLHVFTRLDLRQGLSAKDLANKEAAFSDMRSRMMN